MTQYRASTGKSSNWSLQISVSHWESHWNSSNTPWIVFHSITKWLKSLNQRPHSSYRITWKRFKRFQVNANGGGELLNLPCQHEEKWKYSQTSNGFDFDVYLSVPTMVPCLRVAAPPPLSICLCPTNHAARTCPKLFGFHFVLEDLQNLMAQQSELFYQVKSKPLKLYWSI